MHLLNSTVYFILWAINSLFSAAVDKSGKILEVMSNFRFHRVTCSAWIPQYCDSAASLQRQSRRGLFRVSFLMICPGADLYDCMEKTWQSWLAVAWESQPGNCFSSPNDVKTVSLGHPAPIRLAWPSKERASSRLSPARPAAAPQVLALLEKRQCDSLPA